MNETLSAAGAPPVLLPHFAARVLRDIHDEPVPIPDPGGALVHLQLRRFAGCPICSLHLRSFAQRHDELVAASIREVAVFHSRREELLEVHRQPFAVIPDPDKLLYAELGVGTSPRAVLDPRAWGAAMRAMATGASSAPSVGSASGSFGLPGDFLVDTDGRILAQKVGAHADDHWSVDEVLAYARGARSEGARP